MPLLLLLAFLFVALPAHGSDTTVTLLHFSDYHSHALPFFSEMRAEQGGIARAVGYMRRERAHGAVILSGGDMINKGSPAWSDRERCVEWPWLDGLVDAMAYGNHDSDYGPEVFGACRGGIHYPILSANTLTAEGRPLFPRYSVIVRNGIRIGVFAVAGPDFETLIRKDARPAAGVTFGPSVDAARAVVRELREYEHVDAVVLIGHEHLDNDFALARAVPGIDVIFGTHSHLKRDFMRIPGTHTAFISPYQYLTYISRVELTFRGRRLIAKHGRLVRVDGTLPRDRETASHVAKIEEELEGDPQFAPLFAPIGKVKSGLSVEAVGRFAVQTMREVTAADVALSTASSFRQALPAGVLTQERLRAAMPYDNEIVACSMSGLQVRELLAISKSLEHGDSWSYFAGATDIDPARTYRVAAADFLARVAPRYRDVFAACNPQATGKHVRGEVAGRMR
jgi:5'-nucleotidase